MVLKIQAMPGDVDSVSVLDGEKEDYETSNLNDVQLQRRKLQEKQQNKAEKSEDLDQLESWHKKLLDAGFSVEILQLTSN